MIAFGWRASISATGVLRETISLYTCASRTRRAISCAYCAPKSTTRTRSCSGVFTTRTRLSAHADALRPLERLALGLERRCDHHFGLLEFLHRLVAGRGHRRAQTTEQVHRAVVLVRGPDEDLGERAALPRVDACAARERGVECRHAPVVTAARRF